MKMMMHRKPSDKCNNSNNNADYFFEVREKFFQFHLGVASLGVELFSDNAPTVAFTPPNTPTMLATNPAICIGGIAWKAKKVPMPIAQNAPTMNTRRVELLTPASDSKKPILLGIGFSLC